MISKSAIKTWITTHSAAEFERDHIDYYLHITDAGEIVDDVRKADKSIVCTLTSEDYGMTLEEYQTAENPEAIYDHEVDGDPIFERIVDELYREATEYLCNKLKRDIRKYYQMDEYISRKAIDFPWLASIIVDGKHYVNIDEVYEAVKELPSSNVRPVVYGEWKEYGGTDAGFHYCSVCKGQAFNYEENGETIEVLSDFCPYCGADMKGKKIQENV